MPDRPVTEPILPTRRRPRGRQAPLPDPMAVRRVEVPDWLTGPPPAARRQSAGRPEDPGSGPGSPGPGSWPSQFAQVLAETLAGTRAAQQLRPWTTEQTRQRIRELGPMLATGQRPRVRRIMASAPAADVLEITAIVDFGPRVRVLALRLERAGEAGPGWLCTALESA